MMDYPPISLKHLRNMTDSTGLIQHAVHGVPNRVLGYTTDDNSRALIVAATQYDRTKADVDLSLAITYLSFIQYAFNPEHMFRNVMNYRREFLDEHGTEDCFGRTMWACGYAASSLLPVNVRTVAKKIFDSAIAWVGDLESPRARAYSILGMCHYLRANEDSSDLRSKVGALAESLMHGLRAYSDNDWHWFEPYLTYGNAILPQAMFVAAEITGRKQFLDAALSTTAFLTEVLIPNDYLDIIGNNGWYVKGKERAIWDQQSVDAAYAVLLYASAYRIVGKQEYKDLAHTAFQWFFGRNRNRMWVYDTETHGCFDAIAPWGVNLNQGAESVISVLLAQFAVDEL
jgi:hypothetical protein